MKSFITILTSFFMMLALTGEAEAKRFGGGGFGKSYKTSPFKKKSEPQRQQSEQKNQQNLKNSGANQKRGGLMGGMLGGLLAGGLFAYLLGSGAFEGIQFMDILLLAVVAFVALKIFRSIAGAQQQPLSTATGLNSQHRNVDIPQSAMPVSRISGSAQITDDVPLNLPEGFDAEHFLKEALNHYRIVQQAWNDGHLDTIEEYVSSSLFSGLKQQREHLMVPPQTHILDLNAEVVRANQHGTTAEISILFRGRCTDALEKSEDGIFDTWHLERDTATEGANWVIVGIEAE